VNVSGGIANLTESLFFGDFCNLKEFWTTKKGRPIKILKKCPTKKIIPVGWVTPLAKKFGAGGILGDSFIATDSRQFFHTRVPRNAVSLGLGPNASQALSISG
jgi:hypothetical protein